jgi:hypothetical protein
VPGTPFVERTLACLHGHPLEIEDGDLVEPPIAQLVYQPTDVVPVGLERAAAEQLERLLGEVGETGNGGVAERPGDALEVGPCCAELGRDRSQCQLGVAIHEPTGDRVRSQRGAAES